jgi:hypothetical protein
MKIISSVTRIEVYLGLTFEFLLNKYFGVQEIDEPAVLSISIK